MNTENDLLQAFRANPQDAAARQAYIEWLEQRRDPRGEFLRLQGEVSRLTTRLRELAQQIDPDWLAEVGRSYRVVLKKFSPDWRLEIIKALQQAAHLDVDQALELLDRLPATVREGLAKGDAE